MGKCQKQKNYLTIKKFSLKDHMYFLLKENRCDSRELHRKLRLWTSALYGWKTVNKLSKSLLHLSDPMSSTPFGDIVSWMTVLPGVSLPCLSTRHCLSLVQCTPDTQGSLFSSLMFGLKATLEELSYTVVSNIPSASLLFALYVHVCVSVCANSLQELSWKKDFCHHPRVPST